jgi:hypothetical protein
MMEVKDNMGEKFNAKTQRKNAAAKILCALINLAPLYENKLNGITICTRVRRNSR